MLQSGHDVMTPKGTVGFSSVSSEFPIRQRPDESAPRRLHSQGTMEGATANSEKAKPKDPKISLSLV
jgi:hypothetical protein